LFNDACFFVQLPLMAAKRLAPTGPDRKKPVRSAALGCLEQMQPLELEAPAAAAN